MFDSGEIATAVRASMAIPYVFTPVVKDDRVLVDGGLTNNVLLDAIFHTYEVMQEATTAAKLISHPVDIHLPPPSATFKSWTFIARKRSMSKVARSKANSGPN